MDNSEQYGRSPLVEALDDIRAFNAIPVEERAYVLARFVDERIDNEV